MAGRHLRLAAGTLLLLAASLATAASTDDWDRARTAWAAGDFARALELFEQARDAGLDTPAVHYNIGVSQFRLGLFDASARTFRRLADRYPEMRALAEYNLGLIARRQDATGLARQHFLRAYDEAGDDVTLRILASRRLGEIGPLPVEIPEWSGAIGGRLGNDSNVALRDEAGLPAGTSAESAMLDVFGTARRRLGSSANMALEGSVYVVRYPEASDYDQADMRFGLVRFGTARQWQWEGSVQVSAGFLGGDSFDRKLGVQGRVSRALDSLSTIELRARLDDIRNLSDDYAPIRGSRFQLDVAYGKRFAADRMRLRAGFEANNRDGASVSPRRYRLAAEYRHVASDRLDVDVGAEFRRSLYNDLEPGRDEDLSLLRAAVNFRPGANWLLTLEAIGADNDSTDPEFSYERLQIAVGVMRTF